MKLHATLLPGIQRHSRRGEAAVINAFSRNMRDAKKREKLSTHNVKTAHELYTLADKCALMEEGRLGLELTAKAAADPAAVEARKKKAKRPAKRAFVTDLDTSTVPGRGPGQGPRPPNLP